MQPNLIQANVINDSRGGSANEVLTLLLPNPAHMHGIYSLVRFIPDITLVSSIVVLILQLCDRKNKFGINLTRDSPHHMFL